MVQGFYNAPVTKIIFWSCIAMTFLSNSSGRISGSVHIADQSQITNLHQLWRLFTSLLPSESIMEGLISWYILYTFRILEQQYGSSKYIIFIFLSTLLGIVTRTLLLSVPSTVMHGLASGPYHLIFGLLPLYIRYIPSLIPVYFRIGWLKFNDKSLIYILLLQLFFSGGLRSILPSLAGLGFGILYSIDKTYLNRLRIPLFLRTWFRRSLLPYIQSLPPHQAAVSGNYVNSSSSSGSTARLSSSSSSSIRNNATSGTTMNRRSTTTTIPTPNETMIPRTNTNTTEEGPEPSNEAVQELMNLGFTEADVRRELRKSWGNVEVAAGRLLDQH